MSIEVNIHRSLRHLTNGQAKAEVNGNTVGHCLFELVKQFPGIKTKLFDKKGKLLNYVDIYVNAWWGVEPNSSIWGIVRIDLILSCGSHQSSPRRLGTVNLTVFQFAAPTEQEYAKSRKRLAIAKNKATFLYFMGPSFFG
jgi:hypothetical protein